MTVGNGIRNLSHFEAEQPVIAAGVQEALIDKADDD